MTVLAASFNAPVAEEVEAAAVVAEEVAMRPQVLQPVRRARLPMPAWESAAQAASATEPSTG